MLKLFKILLLHSLIFFSCCSFSRIHVIGDSHAFFCFNNTLSGITADEVSTFRYCKNNINIEIPFYIHWLESRTMHRVGRDGIAGLNIRKMAVAEGDIVVYLFGEVDVRCHIGRQRDEKRRNEDEVISTLVNAYLNTIEMNHKNYKNITSVVVSVTPPCDRGFNVSYPFYGPLSERVKITQKLNRVLCEECEKKSVYFLDIYSMFADIDGSLNFNFSDGIVHIHPKHNKCIKEKLIDILNMASFKD